MTESEQATRGFKRPAAQPLDRENLPEEFTVQFIKSISNQDAIWLEREADLTELQRSSLQAAMTELLGPVTESARKKLEAFTKDLSNKFSFPKADRLGVEIIGTLAELDKTIAPSPRAQLADLDLPVVRRHEEQQKNLRQLETLLRQLVERTEQQHRAAERQRITNWLLAWIAGSSMIGTFATIEGSSRFLVTGVGVAVVGVLLLLLFRRGPDGR